MSSKSISIQKEDSKNKLEEICKKESDSSNGKITTYFSVLRPEGRAKMCALKANDSKQKEILQKLKNKETVTQKPKNEDEKYSASESVSKIDLSSSQSKEKLRGNICISSALKTPLSQVLRKVLKLQRVKRFGRKSPICCREKFTQSRFRSVRKEEKYIL
ncbi:uncharacterized protein CEXT_518671 [Caerostris extrusa]|uniref:Uncharacterized protein n=1 Tax=Caerostris extrusa TaxID=172846 RepID=A0AAV4TXS0_CAEEX|nr:uncharacterized protein CEXT_518671 [Caerostris extrusa]